MDRINVISSNIKSIGYDGVNRILEFEFHNNRVYQYFNVPPSLHLGLLHADSHGKFFAREIRDHPDRFPYARLA